MTNDGRGLDHLMEQNDTELDFLSAYGGTSDADHADGEKLLAALHRFLKAGGMTCTVDGSTMTFSAGSAVAEEGGCRLTFNGHHLPLVESDMGVSGFSGADLDESRSVVRVLLTAWGLEQRRFVERLVEHHQRA